MPDPTLAISTVPQRMQAFLAALGELEEADRARLLRAYLEYTLEIAQAREEQYFTFLGECALLAADNMQDIRIDDLELRVSRIANPPPKEWGEVVTEVAVGLALQFVIWIALEGVAAGVVAIVAWKEVSAATRAARDALSAARSGEQKNLELLLGGLQQQKKNLKLLERGGYVSSTQRGGWRIQGSGYEKNRYDFQIPTHAKDAATGAVSPQYLRDELNSLTAKIAIAQAATRSNSVATSKALAAYDAALANGPANRTALRDEWGDFWRDNIGNEKGGILVSLTQTAVSGSLEAAGGMLADPAAPANEPFLSSEVTGRYLNWTCTQRQEIAEEYANLRLLVRSTSDSDLIEGDPLIMHIACLGTEVLESWRELQMRPLAARGAVVKGMEAAFWREYLLANGILVAIPKEEFSVRDRSWTQGSFVAGHLVLDVLEDDPRIHYETNIPGNSRYRTEYYPGASHIPDQLARTLFLRFAKPFYDNEANARTLLPFKYDPANYIDVQVPPQDDFWGFPVPGSLRRIDEMRFMVIRFFMDLRGDNVDAALKGRLKDLTGMEGVLGETASESNNAWLIAQPMGVDRNQRNSARSSEAATRDAEGQFQTMSQLTLTQPGNAQGVAIAELILSSVITDMNLDIQAYALLKSHALEIDESDPKRNEHDLEMQIESEKDVVLERYNELLNLVGDDSATRKVMEQTYKPAVDALRGWQAGQDWVFYGADRPFNPSSP
jgi:hypothetical protein